MSPDIERDRHLSVPLTDGFRNILVNITNKDVFNKFIELNKILNNVCIIQVNEIQVIRMKPVYANQSIFPIKATGKFAIISDRYKTVASL